MSSYRANQPVSRHGRTRLGKVVGSIRTNPEGYVYWPERNWTTGEPGFMVVYPSGARKDWVATEEEAEGEVVRLNAEWFGG